MEKITCAERGGRNDSINIVRGVRTKTQNAVSMFILIALLKERQTENEFCEERKSIREKV